MTNEEFAEWMMLEAKADREGLPVDPMIKGLAVAIDAHLREIAAGMFRIAKERTDEIERFSGP